MVDCERPPHARGPQRPPSPSRARRLHSPSSQADRTARRACNSRGAARPRLTALSLAAGTAEGNTARGGGGGVAAALFSASLTVTGGQYAGNAAATGSGGTLFAHGGSALTASGVAISASLANGYGGAVAGIYAGVVTLSVRAPAPGLLLDFPCPGPVSLVVGASPRFAALVVPSPRHCERGVTAFATTTLRLPPPATGACGGQLHVIPGRRRRAHVPHCQRQLGQLQLDQLPHRR